MLVVVELVLGCLNAFGAGTGHYADALEAHATGDVHYFDYVRCSALASAMVLASWLINLLPSTK